MTAKIEWSESQLKRLRSMLREKMSHGDIARSFGVSRQTVSNLVAQIAEAADEKRDGDDGQGSQRKD